MSRSLLHDWEPSIENLSGEMSKIAEDIYNTAYARGKNHSDVAEVLDKIRAEIEKVVWEDVIVSLDGTDEVRIPCLDPDDVFEIFDKYKAESEE